MLRLLSSLLLLPTLLFAQEQTLRLRPPFRGLEQQERSNIPPTSFSVFSNVAVNNFGEIYKRGSFGTMPYNSAAAKVDSSRTNGPINAMFRFYRSHLGGRQLLVNTIVNRKQGIYSPWYFFRDTAQNFSYSYTGASDSMSQVAYNDGKVATRLGGSSRLSTTMQSKRFCSVSDTSTTFSLHCANRSALRAAISGYDSAIIVNIVNDTTLLGEGIADHPATSSQVKYELWYQSAHSGYTPFFTMCATYLDTVLFSNSMTDPVGWDGSRTNRLNVLDYGKAYYMKSDSLVDRSKGWVPNAFTGMWLFRRMMIRNPVESGDDSAVMRTNWMPIKSNTATTLKLGWSIPAKESVGVSVVGDSGSAEYSILSMPIDEPFLDCYKWSTAGASTSALQVNLLENGMPSAKQDSITSGQLGFWEIIRNPVRMLIMDGVAKGEYPQITYMGKQNDSILVVRFMDNPTTNAPSGKTHVIFFRARFPKCKFVFPFKDRMLWISDTTYQNSIFPSIAGTPGWVVPNTQITVNPNDGEVIAAAWADRERVVAAKPSKLYEVTVRSIETSGENPDIWQVNVLSNTVGCESPRSVVQRAGVDWFFDWPQGFYELNDNQLKKISEPIRKTIDSVTSSARDQVWGVYYPSKTGDLILWGLPMNGSTKCNRIMAYSPSTEAWSSWDLTNTDSVRTACALVQEGVGDNGELYVGLADSAYLLRYNPTGNQDTLRGPSGNRQNTFVATIESGRFALPGQRIRFMDGLFLLNMGAAGTINFDFYNNLSSSSLQTLAYSASSGDNNFKKSFSDALIGNQLSYRITTQAAQTFKFSGLDLTIVPVGRRLPE